MGSRQDGTEDATRTLSLSLTHTHTYVSARARKHTNTNTHSRSQTHTHTHTKDRKKSWDGILQVSCAKEPYKRDVILQKRPINLRSLLIVATPYRALQRTEKKKTMVACRRPHWLYTSIYIHKSTNIYLSIYINHCISVESTSIDLTVIYQLIVYISVFLSLSFSCSPALVLFLYSCLSSPCRCIYAVATLSRLLQILRLFCIILSLL